MPPVNLVAFNVGLAQGRQRCIEDALVKFHKKLTFDALTMIVPTTPFLTGRARGEWQTAIGESNEDVIERFDYDPPTVSVRSGIAAVTDLKPFSVVFIFNNISYIKLLEEGHSRKSRDMVQNAYNALKDVVAKVVI